MWGSTEDGWLGLHADAEPSPQPLRKKTRDDVFPGPGVSRMPYVEYGVQFNKTHRDNMKTTGKKMQASVARREEHPP